MLIVDDHDEAGDGAEAIAKVRAVRPDVVLVDIQLPDLDGFAVAEQIAAWPDPCRRAHLQPRCCRLSLRLASTPARGFIAKSQLPGKALADLVA